MDENDEGAMVAMVTTENASEVTVDNDYFEVADGNLKLKDGMSLDFENVEGGMIELTLTASGDGESATAMVTVTVNDVNEDPSIDVRDGEEVPGHPGVVSSLTIEENAMRGEGGPPPLALIEVMDPDAADADMLTGDAGVAATSVSDDRFAVILDPEDGLWLHLAEGASLNYEDGSEVMVTVTYTDSGGNTASQDVTVMVTDVNEGPVAVGMVPTVTAESGERIDVELDLDAVFNDPDAGDANLRYELSGNPSWLSLTTDGRLRGEPPITGDESAAAHMVTITATDSGGESGSVSFYVIVDDGNDDVTGVNLLDDDGNALAEVEVNENDASGVVLGLITVDDIDHPMHPHGQHLITVDDSRFEIKYDDEGLPWLVLKEGVSLDTEMGNEVQVTVTAVDINGERLPNGRFKGTSDSQTFAVIVNDENDGPRAGTIGNWWVTVDDDLEAEDVDKGDWLSFSLETPADGPTAFPAFRDQDLNAGDTLTYSISGPSWLEIDEETGHITNAEGAVPSRGAYNVRVTATDSDGQSASASFRLNVALSEPDDNYTDANEEPEASLSTRNPEYDENSGDRRVATFTVNDDDQDIPDHPFGLKTVEITSIVNSGPGGEADTNNAYLMDHDSNPATPMRLWTTSDGTRGGTATTTNPRDTAYVGPGYAGAFVLSGPSGGGDTWTFHIYVEDTDPGPGDTTRILNHEDVEEITIRIRAVDGVTDAGLDNSFAADTDQEILEIDIGIEDINERPTIVGATPLNPGGTLLSPGTAGTPGPARVNQSEDNKIVLYINLEDLWEDDRDEPDDFEDFDASSSVSWIDILYEGQWDDVIKGPDGDTGGGDDLTWGTPGGTDLGRTVGSAPADANDDLWVVIVEIDRTERNTQGDRGSIRLTAEDDDDATGIAVIPIVVTDENEDIGDNAVSLSGSAREGSSLRVSFNDNRDPDLAGSAMPALVLYTWESHADTDGTPGPDTEPGSGTVLRVSTSNDPFTLTQSQVGLYVSVRVTYYETFGGSINSAGAGDTDGQDGGSAVTSRAISDTPDDGVGHFTITASANTLTAAVRVVDEDYGNTAPTITTYQWQVSDNGRGGWEDVAETDPNTATPVNEALQDATLTLDDGDGKYYRVVASYNETPGDTSTNPDQEEVVSHVIQVANVRDTALDAAPTFTAPTISGSPFVGGTLSVEGRGISSVQWQVQRGTDWFDIPGATGDLSVTSALDDGTVRAVVSYDTTVPGEDGITTITTTATQQIGDGTANVTGRPTAVDDHAINASVEGTGHAARATGNAGVGEGSGVTVSVMEMVDLASLFQDPDTPASRLSFSAAPTTDGGLPTAATGTGRSAVFQNAAGVLVMEPDGTLTYVSDQLRGHDGNQADGAGNVLSLDITANDSPIRADSGNSANMAAVTLRINVAPTAIEFDEGSTASGDLTGLINAYTASTVDAELITGVTVNERVTATGREVLAMIDVQDENFVRHPFGSHDVTVTGDDRFVITHTGGGRTDSPATGGDSDGSTWELRVVRGSRFDHETDDMDPSTPGTQIVLTITATDGGGLSTPAHNPAAGYFAIRLVVTVEDNPIDNPPVPLPSNTPGLKDDADDDDNDDTTDGNDGDVDGGDATPPPPGGSLGGIIEDFIDNMDGYDQDLLEDFLLTIDDGLDIV